MQYLETHLVIPRCPHCRIDNPNLHEKARIQTNNFNHSYLRFWAIYGCSRCGGVITAASETIKGRVIEIYPSTDEVDGSLPERAKAYLSQAKNSVHAPSGAIMLAASSIDAMLIDKGYKKGSLYSRINKATTDHLITATMSDWAHQVRLGANDERHPDETMDLPDEIDAQKTIDFALALAEYLFVLPSRVERGIEKAKETSEIQK